MNFTDIMKEALRIQGESIAKGEDSQTAMVAYLNGVNAGLKAQLRPVPTNPATADYLKYLEAETLAGRYHTSKDEDEFMGDESCDLKNAGKPQASPAIKPLASVLPDFGQRRSYSTGSGACRVED